MVCVPQAVEMTFRAEVSRAVLMPVTSKTSSHVLLGVSRLRGASLLLQGCAAAALVAATVAHFRDYRFHDGWDAYLRRHKWAWVRHLHTYWHVHSFAWRLERACCTLPAPREATETLREGGKLLEEILSTGPNTYQKKASNRAQIESLLNCVVGLLPWAQRGGRQAMVIDLGAGKALLTRAVYEALGRRVAVVALDCRRESKRDRFYDPPEVTTDSSPSTEAPVARYTRIVGDVSDLASLGMPVPEAARGGVIALAKHLCGGATDGSLRALCTAPLRSFVGACCIAPCCHQKTKPHEYCNPDFLAAAGFGVGAHERNCRSVVSARDFHRLTMLIQISKAADEKDFATYRKSKFLQVLGFRRCCALGRLARRLLEEGRLRQLRAHGFDAHLVRYCDATTAPDNLAIIATRAADDADGVVGSEPGTTPSAQHAPELERCEPCSVDDSYPVTS